MHEDQPHLPLNDKRNKHLLLLFLALYIITLIPLAVVLRWGAIHTREGPSFAYWPDAMEYAAGAQSIADSGEYYLQVGPHRVRPRYSPGFSMFLAPLLWMGMDATQLCRVPAVIAGLHAVLVAVAVMLLIQFLSPGVSDRGGWLPGVAGLLGGAAWAMAPISVDVGRVPMSDEVASFFSNLALFFAVVGFFAAARARMVVPLLVAGLALGIAASIRSVEGILLVPPLVLIFMAACVVRGRRLCTRRASWLFMGYLIPTGLTWFLLYRSGFSPWTWSFYEYWTPEWYGDLSKTFSLQYALHGETSRPLLALGNGEPLGFWWIPAQVFLGIRETDYYGFGHAWSWLGLPALLYLAYRVVGRAASKRMASFGVVLAILGWILGHVVVFSTYFFHSERFYIPAAAVWCMIIFAALGLSYLSLRGVFRYLAPLICILFLLGEMTGVQRIWQESEHGIPPAVEEVHSRIGPWMDLPDSIRSGVPVPFNTVLAQAMGLLPNSVTEGIGNWGKLAGVHYHDYVVRMKEQLTQPTSKDDAREREPPPLSSFPEGTRALGKKSLHYEFEDRSLHFTLRSPDDTELVHYRVPLRADENHASLRIEELHHDCRPLVELIPRKIRGERIRMDLVDWIQVGESAQIRYLLWTKQETVVTLTAVLELHGRSLRIRLVSDWPFELNQSIQLRLETHPTDRPGVHLATHWDWFASQAQNFSIGPVRSERNDGIHPVLEKKQKLFPGSVATFYVTVSEDARDLDIVQPGPQSSCSSLMFEAPLLLSDDTESFSRIRKTLHELLLPTPLRIGTDAKAEIRLLGSRPLEQVAGKTIGELLHSKMPSRDDASKAGPIATRITKQDSGPVAHALDDAVDLRLMGPAATTQRIPSSKSQVPMAREVSVDEDALDRARRIRNGILPVFRVAPQVDYPWERLLVRYVYLELPLLRAVSESTLLSEDSDGGEGRLHLKFESGLQLWLNLTGAPWSVSLGNKSYRLGRGGYLAAGSNGFRAGFIEDADGATSRFLRGVDGITATSTSGMPTSLKVRDTVRRLEYHEVGLQTFVTRVPHAEAAKFVIDSDGVPRLGLGQKSLRLRFSRVDGGRRSTTEWSSVVWESLDPKVASVNRFGVVQIQGEGVARIRASLKDGKSAAEMALPASLQPVLSDIRWLSGSDGLALGFRCDRPCRYAGVLIQTPGLPDTSILASHDPSWMTFSLWIPASALKKHSTLTLMVEDQFGLPARSKPLPSGR